MQGVKHLTDGTHRKEAGERQVWPSLLTLLYLKSTMKQRGRARAGARAKRRVQEQWSKPNCPLTISATPPCVSASSPPNLLGVHIALTHLVGAKLATPAVTLRAVLAEATEDSPAAGASTGKGPKHTFCAQCCLGLGVQAYCVRIDVLISQINL